MQDTESFCILGWNLSNIAMMQKIQPFFKKNPKDDK